jgi:hypothetical protein
VNTVKPKVDFDEAFVKGGEMVHEHDREKFRDLLKKKRNQVLDYRNQLGEAWRDLQEREPEMQERAQNEFMSRNP